MPVQQLLSSKPFLLFIIATSLLTGASWLKLHVTGSFMVDDNPARGAVMYVIAVMYFLSIAIGMFACSKVVFRKHGYDLDLRQTKLLAQTTCVISAFMAPMLSNDITRYLANGELLAQGITTYADGSLHRLSEFAPYVSFHWIDTPSFYGPPLLYIFYISVFIGKSISGSMIAYKAIMLAFAFIYIHFAARYFRLFPSIRFNMAALLTLSPLLWIQGTGQGHNEMAIITFIMAGIYFLRRKKFIASALCLGLVPLCKTMYSVFIIPYFVLYVIKSLYPDFKAAGKILFSSFLLFIASGFVFYLPVWEGGKTVTSGLAGFYEHNTPTKSHVEVITDAFVYAKPLLEWVRGGGASGQHIIADDANLDDLKKNYWNVLTPIFNIFGLAVAAFTLLPAFKNNKPVILNHLFGKIIIIVFCFYSAIFHPWYLLLSLPFFADTEKESWIKYIIIVFSLCNAHEIMFTIPRDSSFYWVAIFLIFLMVVSFFLYFKKHFWLETIELLKPDSGHVSICDSKN